MNNFLALLKPLPNPPKRGGSLLSGVGFLDFVSPKATNSPPGRGKGWVAESDSISVSETHPYPSQEGNSGSRSGSIEKKPTPERGSLPPFKGRFFTAQPPNSPPGRGWGGFFAVLPFSEWQPTPCPSQEGNSGSRSGSIEKKPTPERGSLPLLRRGRGEVSRKMQRTPTSWESRDVLCKFLFL